MTHMEKLDIDCEHIIPLSTLCEFAKEVCGFDTAHMSVYECNEAVRDYCTKNHDELDSYARKRLELMKKAFGIVSPSSEQEKSDIKDSGDRTEFASGAVRDMHEGKGRCDLMPLDVTGEIVGDEVFDLIYKFQTSGNYRWLIDVIYSCSLLGDCPDTKCRYINTIFLEVAKHFEEGAKKYGEHNWQKGIPVKYYIDSAVRHYLKYLRGDTDEPHDRAFVWNILCCIWTCKHIPELNDYAKKEYVRGCTDNKSTTGSFENECVVCGMPIPEGEMYCYRCKKEKEIGGSVSFVDGHVDERDLG